MNLEEMLSNLLRWIATGGVKLIVGLIILLIGWKVINKVVKVMNSFMRKKNVDLTLSSFLDSFVSIILKIILVISIIEYVGGQATSLAAILGSAGLAIGLALQGSLSNFAGGVIILFLRPFKVGDYIDGAGQSGTVEKIGIFYTYLLTPDNKQILIPNGNLSNGTVMNYSAKDTRRVDLTFSVGYEQDILRVKKVLEEIVATEPLVLKQPEHFIALSQHGDSTINFAVRVWCNTADYWTIYFNLLERVKVKFDEEDISIPFPQMELHINNKSNN